MRTAAHHASADRRALARGGMLRNGQPEKAASMAAPAPSTRKSASVAPTTSDEMRTGNWEQAIKLLEKLEARYPFGTWAQQAQLDTAYAHYKDGERALSLAAIDRFMKLHPNHESIDYALYLKGIVNFNEQQGLLAKLGSQDVGPDGPSLRTFVNDFLKRELDNFLHKNPEVAKELQKRIMQSERERKEIADIKKLANQRAKKANLHNKKLRDCRLHFNEGGRSVSDEDRLATTIFITEGDSASGSITKARDVQTQAVFSLRGKPLNCYGLTKKVVYENEEFNLLQHALNIEDSLEDLRYNRVVVATDADVDGMHIRLLLLTFFLQFFPDLVRAGHLYILDTPLFRVRDKNKTYYCYSEAEKQEAVKKLKGKAEITRFKGLGEISPSEFKVSEPAPRSSESFAARSSRREWR